MSPLSLVGMTEGAKKRAARLLGCGTGTRHPSSKRFFLARWVELVTLRARGLGPGTGLTYPELRARHRLGERLRPCRGCERCRSAPVRFRALPQGRVVIIECNGHFYGTAARGAAWLIQRGDDGWRRVGPLATFRPKDKVRIVEAPWTCDGSGVGPARRAL